MKNSKPILLTQKNKDGNKQSVVYHPFWGDEPKPENADEIKETEDFTEYIYYNE